MRAVKHLKSIKGRMKTVDAPILKRTGAFIIDLLMIDFIVVGPFRSFFLSRIGDASSFQAIYTQMAADESVYGALFIIGMLTWLYFVLQEWKLSTTLGKMVLNLRVEPKLSFWQAALRNLAVLPFFPFMLLWIIDPLFLVIYKQRLSDRLVGSRVVQDIFTGWL